MTSMLMPLRVSILTAFDAVVHETASQSNGNKEEALMSRMDGVIDRLSFALGKTGDKSDMCRRQTEIGNQCSDDARN